MRTGWGRVALAGVVLLSTYLLLPWSVRPVVYGVAGLLCLVSIVVGLRLYRPSRPGPWVLLAVGVALWAVGNVLYSSYTYRGGAVPFPSWADAAYLGAYPVLVCALVMAVGRTPGRDPVAWQDAATWVVGTGLLGWEWLLEPVLESPGSLWTRSVAAASPLMDVVLLLLLARLLGSRSGPPVVYRALGLSLTCYLVSDVLYGVQSLDGSFQSGGYVDLGWLAAYVGIATTALHPRMVDLAEPRAARARPSSRLRLLSLVAVAVTAPAVMALHDQRTDGGDDLTLLVVGALVLFLLTAWRGAGLLREMDQLTADLRGREAELEQRATRDVLTGLPNRSVLQERLERELASDRDVSVAIIDLDDFKHVNDASGHEVGDALLVQVSRCLVQGLRADELVARLGGDEFAVVSADGADLLGRRIVTALTRCAAPDGPSHLAASTGVVSSAAGPQTTTELLRCADLAMYTAKRAGGGRATVYQPSMSSDLLAQLELRRELATALQDGDFTAWLQPVVDLGSRRLLGFEALARWERPGCPAESPGSWLPTAELTGLVVGVDAQVLRSSVRQLVAWTRTVPEAAGLDLAVNASGQSLQEPRLAQRVLQVLAEEGLDPARLVLEVTEGVLLDDAVGDRLQQLRAAGVRIALDDFGTGWSSLDYLRRFPVDMLKIDCSFVAGLGTATAAQALPGAVLQLAAALDLDVVAEGVETTAQAAALLALGCRSAQGFLLGRPAPAADFVDLVRRTGSYGQLGAPARLGAHRQPDHVDAGWLAFGA